MSRRSGGHVRRSGGMMVAPAEAAARREPADFSAVRGDTMRLAAERVLERWTNERGDAVDRNEMHATLLWIARATEDAANGTRPPKNGPAASALGRHLLDLLRTELLDVWSGEAETSSAELLLARLKALEAVRAAIDPDWSQYFIARLSGPDGLDLVVDVAHDLRSPVTSILFLAETLSRGQSGQLNDLQRRQLRLIYSAALGLSSMTSDVIELARGQDQLVETEASPFHVAGVIESVLDMVRPIAEEKGLELRFTPPASDYRLGRPLALSRIILNLTTNALKFTDEGFVEISVKPKGMNRVVFGVRDSGHGVSEEALANLYQPFRRTKARSGRGGYFFSGTGLGLAMCRKLVEELGSELMLESSREWGTLFTFELDLPVVSRL